MSKEAGASERGLSSFWSGWLADRALVDWLHLAALLLGVILRTRLYVFNRSLWLDEAYLAANLVDRTVPQLATPLDFNQVAPFGFLAVTKLLTALFGTSELVLRLLPFISSLLALLLVSYLGRRYLSAAGSVSALLLLAVAPAAVSYAVEFKPYSSDIAIASLLLLAGFRIVERDQSEGLRLPLLAIGVIAVWLSLPAVFVLAGVAIADALLALADRDWRRLRVWLPVYGAWGASFLLMLPQLQQARSLLADLSHWHDGYAPLPPSSLSDLEWFLDRYIDIPNELLSISYWSGVPILALLGGVDYLQERTRQAVVIICVLAMTVLASGLEAYPFRDRAVLFLLPLLVLLLGAGLQRAVSGLGSSQWWAAAMVLLLVLASPMKASFDSALDPTPRYMRQVYLRLQDEFRPSDEVYVYYAAEPLVRYYAHRYGQIAGEFHFGGVWREQPEEYLDEVSSHLGADRVWMVFSHDYSGERGLERELILTAVRCYGEELLRFEPRGGFLYLFDLSSAGGVDQDRWAACEPE